MKKIKSIVSLLLTCVVFTACGPQGCQRTLAPDGVYQSDNFVFESEKTITDLHGTFQTFINWEAKNRAALAQWPEIRKTADTIYNDAPRYFQSASNLLEIYKKSPTKDNRDKANAALVVLKGLLSEVSNHMANHASFAPVPAQPQ